jgi:signal transduction histidine kinase
MMKPEKKGKSDYGIVVSDLGICPFQRIRNAFALMGIIPMLVLFYVMIGKNFFYQLVVGHNAMVITIAISISVTGLFYAYAVIRSLVKRLVRYAFERKMADEEKTELLMAISHDLKAPLSAISLGLQNFVDGVAGPLNGVQAETARACLSSAGKMNGFIDEILLFPKTGFIRSDVRRELVDLDDLLKSEVTGVTHIAIKNDLDIKYRTASSDASAWCDGKKMSRAIANLISNAVKYTPRGGSIDVSLSADADTVQFSVKNTGPGLKPEEIDRIFRKYERLERHSDISGTGLGLSIVKDIIDLHNGRISVESEPGRLTEFKVVLPRDLRAKTGKALHLR